MNVPLFQIENLNSNGKLINQKIQISNACKELLSQKSNLTEIEIQFCGIGLNVCLALLFAVLFI